MTLCAFRIVAQALCHNSTGRTSLFFSHFIELCNYVNFDKNVSKFTVPDLPTPIRSNKYGSVSKCHNSKSFPWLSRRNFDSRLCHNSINSPAQSYIEGGASMPERPGAFADVCEWHLRYFAALAQRQGVAL